MGKGEPRLKAALLYNPAAGRGPASPKRLRRLVDLLDKWGIETRVVPTSPREESSIEHDFSDRDLLVVWGGDGTIHDTLPVALRWRLPLALLPAGTGNVLAHELKIPCKPEQALRLIRQGRRASIHLGRAGERYFHLMAGIGLDGYLIRQVDPRLKRSLGWVSYWLTGARSFWTIPLRPFEIELDGRSFKTIFAVASNCRYYGGQLIMAPEASVFDRCLDVCLFTSPNRSRLLSYVWAALQGKHVRLPDVIYRKASCVEARGASSIPWQIDGDVVGGLPVRISSSNQSVEVFVP